MLLFRSFTSFLRSLEWPTLGLALLIYGCWLTLTVFFDDLPLPLGFALGGLVVAWHGSLQHEAVHGHPTKSDGVNAFIAGFSLWLYLPFALYRDSHLAHHGCEHITAPGLDPESYFVEAERWERLSRISRALFWVNNTLLGRLVIGPWLVVGAALGTELRHLLRGDRKRLAVWAIHAAHLSVLLFWIMGIAQMPLWHYLLFFVYPGLALTLLRSFAEHTPAGDQHQRTVIVEAHPLFSWLFLHNNLHSLHHNKPRLPWYRYRLTLGMAGRVDRAHQIAAK